MTLARRAALLPLALLLATGTVAQDSRRQSYLAPGEFDVTPVLEPAPVPGDPRYTADRAFFRATRKLQGSARYAMATDDVDYSPPAMLRHFSCAAGVQLTPQNAPRLTRVAELAAIDAALQTAAAKEVFRRERPFLIDHGATCQAPAELYDKKAGRMSYDYPSGHSTLGWAFALVLAQAEPDRAGPILARGRAFGDSRYICGVHNESAVEAGRLSASATMEVIEEKPAYQADLAAARDELRALRAGGAPAPENCAAEAALVAQMVMPGVTPKR